MSSDPPFCAAFKTIDFWLAHNILRPSKTGLFISHGHSADHLLRLHREEKNLDELSSLGHFLKGSSATLGFNKIRDSCQVIQQYGHKLDLAGAPETDEEVCLKKITEALKDVKVDYADLEKELKVFFNSPEPNGD